MQNTVLADWIYCSFYAELMPWFSLLPVMDTQEGTEAWHVPWGCKQMNKTLALAAALIDNFWHLYRFLLRLMGSCPSTSFFFCELWINSAPLQIFCSRKREYAERENVEGCPTLVTLSDAEHSKVSHKEGGSLSLLLSSDWSRQITWPEYWPLIG